MVLSTVAFSATAQPPGDQNKNQRAETLRRYELDPRSSLESRVRDSVLSPGFSASADTAAAQGRSVEDVLRSAVEIELPAYDIDRAEMQAEADDDAEVARIGNACS